MKDLLRGVLALLVASLLSSAIGRSVREADYNEETDYKLLPNERTGRLVAEWSENLEENPEEMGNYFEGDILIPYNLGKSGLSAETSRWAEGVIPYEIKGSFDAFEMDTIEKAFNLYHTSTCLRWLPRTNEDSWVRITSDSTGCWSSVGRTGGPQQLNLQRPACLKRIGTVVHEMMHAAGFLHEQTRPDRDEFVTIAFNNIRFGHEHNFDKAKQAKVNDFGVGYDYGSVMHYSTKAFSRNGKSTIIPKKSDVKIGQRKGFSKNDIEKLNRMYNCTK